MKNFFAIMWFFTKALFNILEFCFKAVFGLFCIFLVMFGIMSEAPKGSHKGRFYGEDKYY